MNDLAIKNACHRIDPAEWEEGLASYDRGPITMPDAPYIDLEFSIEFPFAIGRDDTLLFGMYSESREINQRLYDGPPPRDGRIRARLAVDGEKPTEIYWAWVDLIRPGSFMTCGWSMEERFELPYPQYPNRWRVELLPERIPTDDGGSRTTRITPML